MADSQAQYTIFGRRLQAFGHVRSDLSICSKYKTMVGYGMGSSLRVARWLNNDVAEGT